MMEIVATSDLIRPKPTYNPRIITSRFSPHREESPLSPYKQYLPTSSPHDSTSPRNGQPTPCQLPAVTIPFVTHNGIIYQSPKSMVFSSSDHHNSSPPTVSPSSATPTTPLPATPATTAATLAATPTFLQQPTPTRPTPKKIYTCKSCGKTFNNSGNFSRHQKVHTGEKPYRCEICGKAFTQSSTLKRHILSHSGDRSYKCQVCSKGYVDPWSLKKHMKNHGFNTYSHVPVKPILPHYKFHPPNVVVPQKPHLPQPWNGKQESPSVYLPLTPEQQAVSAAAAQSSFKSGGSAFKQVDKLAKGSFNPQVNGVSKSDSDSKSAGSSSGSPTETASADLSNSDALALYMLDTLKQNIKHSQEKKDPESKENDNIMQFTPASKTLPEKESELYTCEKCGRSFNNLNNFKTHQIIHAGSLACNGELSCHQCKAVFLGKQQLQSHMATHTSSYWCVYCERSFRNEYNFKQHQTVHTTLMNENDKKYPTWLESFRQEMLTCVTSLESPHLPMTALNTPASNGGPAINSEHQRESSNESQASPRKSIKLEGPSTIKLDEKRTEELQAMKLKAMMDNDPLGRAILPTFCTPSTMSFYGLGSAGSSYSAASLSGRSPADQFTSLHDPLSRHPVSAGPRSSSSTPFSSLPLSGGGGIPMPFPGNSPNSCFRHPKPIKVEPHPRRPSLEEVQKEEQERKEREVETLRHQEIERQESLRLQETERAQRQESTERAHRQEAIRHEEAARLREEDKRLEACEALQALKCEPVIDALETDALDKSSPVKTPPVKKERCLQRKSPDSTDLKEGNSLSTQETVAAENSGTNGEASAKRARKITYQCCLCEFTSSVLSNLTSHLEGEHSLHDYILIKSLLACLGDIGP